MRHIISTPTLVATLAVALVVGASPAAAAIPTGVPVGTQCASVPYGWAGMAALAPGQSFSTGVVVPVEVGVQLAVEAFDVSTVDPAPNAVAVWIGQGAVADGVAVAGGEIAVTNASASAITLTRVELSLARCYQVASSPAPDAQVPAPAPTTVAPVLTAPIGIALPATGRSSGSVLLLAVIVTVVGAALTFAARRRTTALAHDR